MIDLDSLQLLLSVWQKTNFPPPRPLGIAEQHALRMSIGMGEEVGEIFHHMLKGSQGVRGGRTGYDIDQISNGVIDTFIYGMQLLTAIGVSVEDVLDKVTQEVLERDWNKFPTNGKTE